MVLMRSVGRGRKEAGLIEGMSAVETCMVILLGPYGFGNEFWRRRPCVTMWPGTALEAELEKDVTNCKSVACALHLTAFD
jgi:hypothetical protein